MEGKVPEVNCMACLASRANRYLSATKTGTRDDVTHALVFNHLIDCTVALCDWVAWINGEEMLRTWTDE